MKPKTEPEDNLLQQIEAIEENARKIRDRLSRCLDKLALLSETLNTKTPHESR